MQKYSKRMIRVIVLCMLLLLAVPLALSYTEPTENINMMIFVLDSQKQINEFKVVRDNPFYRLSDKYSSVFDIADELPEDLGEKAFSMKLFNSYDEIIYEAEYYSNFYIPYFEDTKRIGVYDDENKIVFSREISFCNYNNVCEPCEGMQCSVSENSASCADCRSGGSDNYCDLKKDGICDPDCNNLDMDCAGCYEGKCYYEDSMDAMNRCSDFGNVCATFDECAGTVVYADENKVCCSGDCVDPSVDEEYLPQEPAEVEFTGASDFIDELVEAPTDPVELFSLNYNNSIPVEDEGNKILCSNVGKSVCGMFEKCVNGDYVHSDDEGDECCTGDCIPIPEKKFKEKYKEIFGEEYAEESGVPEEFVFAPGIKKTSLLWLLLLLVPLVVIILLSALMKRKKAERIGRLEYECTYYKNYGYNDEQIKAILAQRGWGKKDIKRVIKK